MCIRDRTDPAQGHQERPAAGTVCDRQQVRTSQQPEPEPSAQHLPGAGQARSGLSFRPPGQQRQHLRVRAQRLFQGDHCLLSAQQQGQQRPVNTVNTIVILICR